MLFEKGDTILFIGDSISDYERAKPVGEGLFNAWGRSYVADAGSLLQSTYPELDLRVCNVCTDGDQTRSLLKRWESDVIAWRPDWVCMMIGINDVWRQFDCPYMPETHVLPEEFESTYEKLIQRTLPEVKGMILMTPYFMEPNKSDPMRARMDIYGKIVKKLADQYSCVFVDLQSAWDNLFRYMHPCNIAWDRIHPNQVGCMYIAKQFLRAVGADRA